MADQKAPDVEVRAALFELQQYLSDQVPPLIFADSMSILLRRPTEVVMHEIHTWITAQYRGIGSEVPLSDYLFHAIKKIHLIGEFNLVGKEKLKEYLDDLEKRVLEICPEQDRELLQKNFSMLGDIPASLASPVEVLHRQAGTETRLASAERGDGADAAPLMRHVSMLLERLQHGPAPGSIGFISNREQYLSQALTAAAGLARSDAELQESIESVRHLGLDVDPARSFRLLSQSLPTWAIPMNSIPATDEWPESAAPDPIIAMKRIVLMADDPLESSRRYRQLVDAAVQWFNEGSLGRAVTMLEIAERLETEKAIDPSTAGSVRKSGHEALDQEKLRACSETKDAHGLLKKVLDFFTALTAEGLLAELSFEQRRERRRAILALLEVHGEEARRKAFERLNEFAAERALEGDKVYFVRNLLYVLNRVTPGAKEDVEKEIDLIAGFTATKYPLLVLKESIAALGQTKHERAVRILIRRIGEVEALLSKPAAGGLAPVHLKQLLDRLVLALSRIPGSEAVRAIVDHGLKGNEPFGDTFARLASLSSRDLSEEPDALERMISAIRNELPKKVFGFSMQKSKPRVSRIIEALGGTPAPVVYELLEEIRTTFRDQEYAKAAETVLSSFGSTKAAAEAQQRAPGLAGDLEVFGLPNLLESLSSSGATGVLAIFDRNGKQEASMGFANGRIVACHFGLARGRDGVFALFEEANPGTFAFVSRSSVTTEEGLSADVQPLIFEAVRRYDELREARLLVPETVPLAATGSKPTAHPNETDAKLVREVWVHASAGGKPAEWKSMISADSYRIWRLLSHWVQTGALRVGV